jgi:Tannase and feruloyl esterase
LNGLGGIAALRRTKVRSLLALVASAALLTAVTKPAAAANCADLKQVVLPKTTITLAQATAAGAFTPPVPEWARAFMSATPIPAAFCRVTGEIRPTSDSNIKFELWLPVTGWTGRYESVGNGGFAGSIRYDSMRNPLLGGSAVASTDDGHEGPAIGPTSADWAFGHPEKIIDYGHRAVHLTAVAAKTLTAAFYGRKPEHSYFVGCSKGGQEGFMEAQRYPQDFDGIVSGAAASQWTDLFSSFVWTESINLANQASYLSAGDLVKIGAAVTAACETPATVKYGFISDPQRCEVPSASLGLSPEKLKTFEAIHQGPKDTAGTQIFPGQPYGGENAGWADTISGANFEAAQTDAQMSMYGGNFFRNFVYQDKQWSFHGFDLDKGRADAERVVGKSMNADDMRFAAFKARGGKFIAYAGMVDSIVTPLSSVRTYRAVEAAHGQKTPQFYRLFLAPGVNHCGGGPGPNQFGQGGGAGDADHDMVVALEQWVEKGVAPSRIIATKFLSDDKAKGAAMTRPLCAFPQVAKYRGSGDMSDAVNFACANP